MPRSRHHRHKREEEPPDITVYPNRHRMLGWIALAGIPGLAFLAGIIFIVFILITTPQARNGGAISCLLLFTGFLIMSALMTLMFVYLAFSSEPILLVNHSGIRVGKIYGFSDIVLPWEEVETIYSRPDTSPQILFIQPVDNQEFLKRSGPLMHLTCRMSMVGGAPVALSQSFLDQPIDEILQQIQRSYKRELQLHTSRQQVSSKDHQEQNEIILYVPRSHAWIVGILGGVSVLIIGGVLITHPPQQLLMTVSVAAFMAVCFFGSLYLAWNIIRIPALIINEEGIACPAFHKYLKIKWEEIASISGVTGGYLSIESSPSGTVSIQARVGKKLYPPVRDITEPQLFLSIPQMNLPLPISRLLKQIQARFPQQLERYKIEVESL